MFYFAFIDETNLCTGVYAMPSDLSGMPGYIAITEEQYTSQSVVGKYYDAETNTWVDPPAFACNTDEVQYKETGTTLSSKLDNMDAAIEDAVDAADAATEAAHTHGNKTILDGITAEKVAAWDAAGSGSGTPGTPGADGEDGEDGATFTPSVSAEGILSWTNNKGLANPTSVNIMGPQGATGPQGPAGADGADGADGQDGANGITPHIGTNGHWYIGETDTGVSAQGPAGADGADGEDGAAGTEITAAQILSKLIGVDGSGSGLDADKLDGYDSSAFATAGHSHSEYAPSSHYHSEYAASSHSHSGYASANHSHSDYLPTDGGTVDGNLNVAGILRVNGQQSVYDSGTMITLSTNNRQTMIAGSAIYSKTTISVSSDRRLKENIEEVSADDMTKFINGLDIKSFNYIGNDEPCIGVIAQEVIEADPELAKCFVRQDEEGYYSVKAADLVFPLIATVQKLAREVEELKK